MSDDANNSQGNTGAGNGSDGGDGGGEFLSTIQNEELRANESLKDFKDVDSLAKAYLETKSAIPAVPEKTDGYQIDIPEGVEVNKEQSDMFKTLALENKLTNEQYKAILEFDFARQNNFHKQLLKIRDDAVAEMKKEFGDMYNQNLALAQKTLKMFGAEDLARRADLGNDPDLFRFLTKVGGAISEDRINAGGSEGEGDTRPKTEDGRPMLKFKSMD